MPYANHQGTRIHYKVEGSGPPLVLQHGSTSSHEAWYLFRYVEALMQHYQLILVDGRGHGYSDKPHDSAAYALPLRVGDVVAVLDDLGIEKAHYWGYSMGGWIGFGLAAQAQERLSSLIIGGAHPYEERIDAFRGVDGTDTEAFIAAFERFVGIQATPEIRDNILANDLQALAAAMHDRASQEDVLTDIHVPCCLYVGEDDPRLDPVRACARLIPDATLVTLPGLNHAFANIRSDQVLPPVAAFLNSVTGQ
ncbi:MAG: alpha/beta fold hydrolase [Marinobacter sp.]|nr:alpha/beta fold hydrolase [Marinobacter sp.]